VADRRYVWVEDRRGTRLPFSKGILTNSVMVAGINPEAAYRMAETVEDDLFAAGREVVGVEELTATVERVLHNQLGPGAAATWSTWVGARRAGHPVVVLIGGGTGSGKSTVATRLGARLGISGVVATDAIREVMRGSFPETVLPVLHVSSFEAHLAVGTALPGDHDPVVAGFRQQVEVVISGVRRLVDRALREATDLILEGVHLVPGLLAEDLARWKRKAAVTEMVLSVPDPERHRAHFLTRLERSQSRQPRRYLENFEGIRRIQRYILIQAKAHGVPELEMWDLDESVQTAAELTVHRVISWAGRQLRRVGS
jgi:2-phosphoglycerate kinase